MGAAPPLSACISGLDWHWTRRPQAQQAQAVEDHKRGAQAQGMPPVATSRATSGPVRSNKPRPSLAD